MCKWTSAVLAAVALLGIGSACTPIPGGGTGPGSDQRLEERGRHNNGIEHASAAPEGSSSIPFQANTRQQGQAVTNPPQPNSRAFP